MNELRLQTKPSGDNDEDFNEDLDAEIDRLNDN